MIEESQVSMKELKKIKNDFLLSLPKSAQKSEVDWILCEVTKKSRSELRSITHITFWQYLKAKRIINKRKKGIPLDKILGHTNFYGLDFIVNKDVLIPRFETEFFVEYVLQNARGKGLDIGTGSGAIAIVLNVLGQHKMVATDISKKALRTAQKNAKRLGASVRFLYSDLFDNIDEKFDFIVSNPPYIKSEEIMTLQREVSLFEPKLALDGGEDGLDFFKKIIKEAPKYLKKNGKIFFEIGKGQESEISIMLEDDFVDIRVIKDLSKINRIISATKKG